MNRIQTGDFIADFTFEKGRIEGTLYQGYINKDKVPLYLSKSIGGHYYDYRNDDCRIMFEFSFVWRGVWEGRVYMKDQEYWSEELKEMSDAWDEIQIKFKEMIRQLDPNMNYDE